MALIIIPSGTTFKVVDESRGNQVGHFSTKIEAEDFIRQKGRAYGNSFSNGPLSEAYKQGYSDGYRGYGKASQRPDYLQGWQTGKNDKVNGATQAEFQNSFSNGRARAAQDIANRHPELVINAVRSGLLEKGKTVIWKGREFDVVKVSGDMVTIDDEGNRYTVNARELSPGTTGHD